MTRSIVVLFALAILMTPALGQGTVGPGGTPIGGGGSNLPPNPDYILSIDDGLGFPGDIVSTTVHLDSSLGMDDINGFSFGICSDPALVTVSAADLGADAQVAIPGSGGGNPNGGGPFGFFTIDIHNNGIAVGVILDLFGMVTLPPGPDYELLDIDYTIVGNPGSVADLEFCDSVGVPAVRAELITFNGLVIVPTTSDGQITIGINGPLYTFSLPDVTQGFDSSTGSASFSVGVAVSEDPSSPNFPNSTHGFSMAIGHDSNVVSASGASPGSGLASLNGGTGPEFFSVNTLADGVTIGAVYSLQSALEIVLFNVAAEVASVDYDTNAGTLQGTVNPTTTELAFESALGSPAVGNLVAIDFAGATVPVLRNNGTVTLVPGGPFFVRGDCSADGSYNLGDPLAVLGHLFGGTGALSCDDACDANDDGGINLTDAVFMLENLFSGGANPPSPTTACGADPTPDGMSCTGFGCP